MAEVCCPHVKAANASEDRSRAETERAPWQVWSTWWALDQVIPS